MRSKSLATSCCSLLDGDDMIRNTMIWLIFVQYVLHLKTTVFYVKSHRLLFICKKQFFMAFICAGIITLCWNATVSLSWGAVVGAWGRGGEGVIVCHPGQKTSSSYYYIRYNFELQKKVLRS